MAIPRPEYPRPQFVRQNWLCLNGPWECEIDSGDSGYERKLYQADKLSGEILVPFCPESELSGIGNVDFLNAVWYRRAVGIPRAWAGRKVLLHFGAVDYDAIVWANGQEVGRHRGGYAPFTCDLEGIAAPGETVVITVLARDNHRELKPHGKQCPDYASRGCLYTRTTGIWQTVWMEPVSAVHLLRPRITPDAGNGLIRLELPLAGRETAGLTVRAWLSDEQGVISTAECPVADFSPRLDLPIAQERRRCWSPEDPFLYDLRIELLDASGAVIDAFDSYAGLRSVTIDSKAVKLNGKSVFQRLVLDQGFYPDGIYTAPTDEVLKRDIKLSQAAGFNGARLHQKVFEERFLYWADKLGYLVWGEFADWGCSAGGPTWDHQQMTGTYITQWLEALERDYSHPAIVGWCPLNETWQNLHDRQTALDEVTRGLFLATKAMDATRPVLDTSGYSHRMLETDIYDSHDYEQDVEKFRVNHAGLAEGKPFVNRHDGAAFSITYRGQPYFVSEFGGTWWNPGAAGDSWGYGNRPATIEEFYARFAGLCGVLLDDPNMFGYCYTQLTDVFQEQNGIYYFDRSAKFDLERLRKIQSRPAVIEEAGTVQEKTAKTISSSTI